MTRSIATVVLGLALVACGGDEHSPSSDPPAMNRGTTTPVVATCKEPHGLYRVSERVESGNCPVAPDSIINLDDPGPSVDGCTGQSMPAAPCGQSFDQTCVNDAGRILYRGTIHWTADGSSASSQVYVELYGPKGELFCRGIWAITYKKQ